jgi:hypothetical protein
MPSENNPPSQRPTSEPTPLPAPVRESIERMRQGGGIPSAPNVPQPTTQYPAPKPDSSPNVGGGK